ncbi:MAG: type II toxin-antitoxin system HicB family antitoxin [Bryobacteraceae bacterium]
MVGDVPANWRWRHETYSFKVVVEPDEDRWHAYCPALVQQGAATWGNTQEEALKNIEEVVKLVVESLIEHGETVPEHPPDQVRVSSAPEVAVTV